MDFLACDYLDEIFSNRRTVRDDRTFLPTRILNGQPVALGTLHKQLVSDQIIFKKLSFYNSITFVTKKNVFILDKSKINK